MNAKVFIIDFTSTANKNLIVISENILNVLNRLMLISFMIHIRIDWTS